MGERILVADDEPEILSLLEAVLQKEGYEVLLAADGKKAVEAVKNGSVHVAILDLKMPIMDGLEALREIKEIDQNIQVLIMTGQPDVETLKKIFHHGAFDYLVKPFIKEEIIQTIRQAIERRNFVARNQHTEQNLEERILQVQKNFEERTLQLRETQIQYKEMTENSHDAILVARDGMLKFVNTKALQLTGYSREEILSIPFQDLIHPGDRMVFNAIQSTILECDSPPPAGTFRILRKDGEFLWTEVNAVRSSREKSPASLNFVRDVTERMKAQAELQKSMKQLRDALEGTIHAMALTVETRDPYTAGHQRRVADLAVAIATELGLSQDQTEGIRMAGLIHDIGKLSLPTDILNKPGRLTDTEFDLIKDHAQAGFDILKEISFPWPIAQIVLQHHERLDGSGYPSGVSGEGIILEARILAVADVVEAMGSHRPYRAALGIGAALEEISKNKGVLYDVEIVDVCLTVFSERGYKLDKDSPTASTKSFLVVENAQLANKFFPLIDHLAIGRGTVNDICLGDSKASRLHAVVHRIGDQALIEDLGSRNGTFVNNERIKTEALRHGDGIRIGDTSLHFYQDETGNQVERGLFETQAFADGVSP